MIRDISFLSKTARRNSVLKVRASMPWRAWIERGARYCHSDTAKLVDAAVTAYLEAKGFEELPPER